MNIDVYFSSKTHRLIQKREIKEIQKGVYFIDNFNKDEGFRRFLFRNSFISTILYLIIISCFIRKTEGKTSVLLYPSTDYTMESMCLLILKWILGLHLFCEVNELRRAGLTLVPFSMNPNKFFVAMHLRIKYFFHKNNEYLYKFFNGLIVISTNLEKYYIKFNKNIIRVPILADVRLYNPDIMKFEIGQQFKIGFSGQVNIKKEGLDTLYEAISLVKKEYPNIQLDIYGSHDPRDKKKLDEIIYVNNLEANIFYKGTVPQEKIPQLLNQYNLLVIPRKENLQTKYGFSTKLSDYLLTGVPILTTAISDIKLYFIDEKNAYLISDISTQSFKDKLLLIIKNYNQHYNKIKNEAFKTLKHEFDYRNYCLIISDFLFTNELKQKFKI